MTHDVPVFQFVGCAVGVSSAQSIFTNRLVQNLPFYAPGVEVSRVLALGVTSLASHFDPVELHGILRSYIVGLKDAWLFSAVLTAMAFVISLVAGWKSIKVKKGGAPTAA